MRPIKFRAWNNVKNEMYYVGEKDTIVFEIESTGIIATDIQVDDYNFKKLEHLIYMQYTGLKDVNGTGIYEGDITTNELYKGEGLAFVVYYDNEKGMFKQRPFMFINNGKKLGNKDLTLQMDSVGNKEIIGNTHESPELLEGESNA